jgi:hypothetical protein
VNAGQSGTTCIPTCGPVSDTSLEEVRTQMDALLEDPAGWERLLERALRTRHDPGGEEVLAAFLDQWARHCRRARCAEPPPRTDGAAPLY